MSTADPESGIDAPLFSVIIPLEFHRGQWEQSWLGWTSQTAPHSLYEIILVVPPDFDARAELAKLATGLARVEFVDVSHDIGLCAAGAARARGQFLFFTESHCWPEPDVIALCLNTIAEHPDWAGFSCRSVPICSNRLSYAEAEMYQADIDFGMTRHPWRKVLDQCFVTRRDAYEKCGGLRAEFGHYAEWVLAASYHAHGYTIGYLDTARFHHYYIGKVGELAQFTLDFVRGEMRYLSEPRSDPGHELLEIPIEWSCQDNFDAPLARAAIGARLRGSRSPRSIRFVLGIGPALGRWLGPALLGDRGSRMAARLAVLRARCLLLVAAWIGSPSSVTTMLKRYIAALIDLQRLTCIHDAGPADSRTLPRLGERVRAQAGFHALEVWDGRSFRWSEPEAALRVVVFTGRNMIRLDCLNVREPLPQVGVRFFLDGRELVGTAVRADADGFDIICDAGNASIAVLSWACPRLRAPADARRLGLPVAAVHVVAVRGLPADTGEPAANQPAPAFGV